jgi:hypothetical protein
MYSMLFARLTCERDETLYKQTRHQDIVTKRAVEIGEGAQFWEVLTLELHLILLIYLI